MMLFDSASAARLDCGVFFGYLSLLKQGSPVRTALCATRNFAGDYSYDG